jgi:hypothetical protein
MPKIRFKTCDYVCEGKETKRGFRVYCRKTDKKCKPQRDISPKTLVWEILSSEPIHIDDIIRGTNLSASQAIGILLTLELEGKIQRLVGNMFVRTSEGLSGKDIGIHRVGSVKQKTRTIFDVEKNLDDKKWYVIGHMGDGYWMPISSGYKTRKQAVTYLNRQMKADRAARRLVTI